jgi:hypothetical protein
VGAALLGALPPTLTSILIILPLNGLPMSAFFQAVGAVTGFTTNGIWGLGFTAVALVERARRDEARIGVKWRDASSVIAGGRRRA